MGYHNSLIDTLLLQKGWNYPLLITFFFFSRLWCWKLVYRSRSALSWCHYFWPWLSRYFPRSKEHSSQLPFIDTQYPSWPQTISRRLVRLCSLSLYDAGLLTGTVCASHERMPSSHEETWLCWGHGNGFTDIRRPDPWAIDATTQWGR